MPRTERPTTGDRVRVERSTEDGWYRGIVDHVRDWGGGTWSMFVDVDSSTASKVQAGQRYAVGADADWEVVT